MLRTQTVATYAIVLVCLCSLGHGHLDGAQEEATEINTERGLVLEALKTGILSSLGMEKPPILKQKASQQDLMKVHQLYHEKLNEMSRNLSQITLLLPDRGKTWFTIMNTEADLTQ